MEKIINFNGRNVKIKNVNGISDLDIEMVREILSKYDYEKKMKSFDVSKIEYVLINNKKYEYEGGRLEEIEN